MEIEKRVEAEGIDNHEAPTSEGIKEEEEE